jgi:hypothetical protein
MVNSRRWSEEVHQCCDEGMKKCLVQVGTPIEKIAPGDGHVRFRLGGKRSGTVEVSEILPSHATATRHDDSSVQQQGA